jgi:hypothetical protein
MKGSSYTRHTDIDSSPPADESVYEEDGARALAPVASAVDGGRGRKVRKVSSVLIESSNGGGGGGVTVGVDASAST